MSIIMINGTTVFEFRFFNRIVCIECFLTYGHSVVDYIGAIMYILNQAELIIEGD